MCSFYASSQRYSYLIDREWTGNVRELNNFARRVCVYRESSTDSSEERSGIECTDPVEPPSTPKQAADEAEKAHITAVLNKCKGQITAANKVPGFSRKCLYDTINKHRITLDLFQTD